MDLSKKKQAEAKKLNVTTQYLVMADLCAIGYSESDAYTIAYPENAALSVQQNNSIRSNIVESAKFKKLLAARSETRREAASVFATVNDEELLGKEQTARLIMQAAMKQPSDSKERIEGLMKYSDLMGYKKDDVDGDETGCELLSDFVILQSHSVGRVNMSMTVRCELLSDFVILQSHSVHSAKNFQKFAL